MKLSEVVVCALALAGASCTPKPGQVDIVASPVRIFDDGDPTTLTVTATDSEGKVGNGTVKLSASVGTLGAQSLTLDSFGTAKTTFACDATLEPLCSNLSVSLVATWEGALGQLSVKVNERCPGGKLCSGECVTVSNNWRNCGACGVRCASTQACLSGLCAPCPGGDCDGDGWLPSEGDCCDQYDVCTKPAAINPGAAEAPDNMLDDDCNGLIDAADAELAACDGALLSGLASNPMDFATAIGLCKVTTEDARVWGVLSAELLRVDGNPLLSVNSATIRPVFGTIPPLEGQRLAVFSTAVATDAWQTNPSLRDSFDNSEVKLNMCKGPGCINDWFMAGRPPLKLPNQLPGSPTCSSGGQNGAFGSAMLKLRVRAPSNANSFRVRTRFFSLEYPEFVCSTFNDQMVMLIDTPGVTVNNPSDKNLMTYSTDGGAWPVGINLATGTPLFQSCLPKATNPMCWDQSVNPASCGLGAGDLARTQFGGPEGGCTEGGGTGWMVTGGNVKGGQIFELRTAIWNVGDGALDSLFLMDGFQWGLDSVEPGTGE